MLTASGLTFVGGTDDFRFRAFATATGEKLWEIKLPSSIETTPITYLGADGRQFVTVVSTGGGLTGSRGDQRRDHRVRLAEEMIRMMHQPPLRRVRQFAARPEADATRRLHDRCEFRRLEKRVRDRPVVVLLCPRHDRVVFRGVDRVGANRFRGWNDSR